MLMEIRRIAVYCGSAKGIDPIYVEQAKAIIHEMHAKGMGLVYGGGNVGIMGIIADEMLKLGGDVIGIIPQKLLEKEVAHHGITQLIVVEDMHQRKAKMFELSDAIIALPGGIGTMEELFEAFTWSQLGYHEKPCGVLNVKGYYNHLHEFLQHMVDHGFLKQEFKNMLLFDSNPTAIIARLQAFEFPKMLKWY
jgi:uncharacterized protein (TIGR00730 family)